MVYVIWHFSDPLGERADSAHSPRGSEKCKRVVKQGVFLYLICLLKITATQVDGAGMCPGRMGEGTLPPHPKI